MALDHRDYATAKKELSENPSPWAKAILNKIDLVQQSHPRRVQIYLDYHQHKLIAGFPIGELLLQFGATGAFEFVDDPRRLTPGQWFMPVWLGHSTRLFPGRGDYFWGDLLGSKALELLREKEGHILFDYSYEPLRVVANNIEDFAALPQTLDALGLPKAHAVCVNANIRAAQVAKQLPSTGRFHVASFDFAIYLYLGHCLKAFVATGEAEERLERAKKAVHRRHKFLSFSNKNRSNRTALFLALYGYGALGESLVSFRGPAHDIRGRGHDEPPFREWPEPEREAAIHATQASMRRWKIDEALVSKVQEAYDLTPLSLDTNFQLSTVGPSTSKQLAFGDDPFWPYEDSYIGLMGNTVFSDANCLFFTLNLSKGFFNFQPTIITGDPFTLRRAKKFGFQTFAPYIDESYDELDHAGARGRAVVAEVKRLSAMSLEEIHDIYWKLWPVLEHNHFHLINEMPKKFAASFDKNVTSVLRDIVKQALVEA